MSDQNPFASTQDVADAETSDSEAAFDDVEAVNDSDEDVEVIETAPASTTEAKTETKAPARAPKPEGYITPVEFAHKLTEKMRKDGSLAEGQSFPPQQVYSWVKQGKSPTAKDPLKSYSEGGRENLLKEDEVWAWLERKDTRKKEQAAAKAAREQATADKAKNEPEPASGAETKNETAAPSEQVVEVE